ncbi:hypothetical protein BLNAU_12295 [Blattamonas nauphoetae]|uniref:Uncharacterized protein n=1 Tax=Blattamonas nauphoetae TaxID=2049346 RepID=A0ABQ9XQB9_9EUKA|nr:hypothetical protein BLNAU_12295 [Blattamonas nauphoetae]
MDSSLDFCRTLETFSDTVEESFLAEIVEPSHFCSVTKAFVNFLPQTFFTHYEPKELTLTEAVSYYNNIISLVYMLPQSFILDSNLLKMKKNLTKLFDGITVILMFAESHDLYHTTPNTQIPNIFHIYARHLLKYDSPPFITLPVVNVEDVLAFCENPDCPGSALSLTSHSMNSFSSTLHSFILPPLPPHPSVYSSTLSPPGSVPLSQSATMESQILLCEEPVLDRASPQVDRSLTRQTTLSRSTTVTSKDQHESLFMLTERSCPQTLPVSLKSTCNSSIIPRTLLSSVGEETIRQNWFAGQLQRQMGGGFGDTPMHDAGGPKNQIMFEDKTRMDGLSPLSSVLRRMGIGAGDLTGVKSPPVSPPDSDVFALSDDDMNLADLCLPPLSPDSWESTSPTALPFIHIPCPSSMQPRLSFPGNASTPICIRTPQSSSVPQSLPLLSAESSPVPPRPSAPSLPPVLETDTQTPPVSHKPPSMRRWWVFGVLVVFVCICAVLGIVVIARRRQPLGTALKPPCQPRFVHAPDVPIINQDRCLYQHLVEHQQGSEHSPQLISYG